MKHATILPACLLVVLSCDRNSPTSPDRPIPTNLIANGSFELAGERSLVGWSNGYHGNHPFSDTTGYLFSNDAPVDGGLWSFGILDDSLTDREFHTSFHPAANRSYQFSFWVKNTNLLAWAALGWSKEPVLYSQLAQTYITVDPNWRRYSFTFYVPDTIITSPGILLAADSALTIAVTFGEYSYRGPGRILFDLVDVSEMQ